MSTFGLSKEEVREIVLAKLRIVYQDWELDEAPFASAQTEPGGRRDDPRAFIIALVAALLGGLSEAIERNNAAIALALSRPD